MAEEAGVETGGEDTGVVEGTGNEADTPTDGGILSLAKTDTAGEEAAETDTPPAEGEKDSVDYSIDPDLLSDKAIERFVKDGILDVNELAKGYKEGQKLLRNAVPEEYSFDDAFEAHDGMLYWENDDQRDDFIKDAKEQKISQTQLDWLLNIYGDRVAGVMQHMGPQTDVKAEFEAVKNEWGSEAKVRFDSIQSLVEENPELELTYNMKTQQGMKALWDHYSDLRGSDIVSGGEGGTSGADELESQIQTIMADKEYWTDPAKQQKVTELTERKMRLTN